MRLVSRNTSEARVLLTSNGDKLGNLSQMEISISKKTS